MYILWHSNHACSVYPLSLGNDNRMIKNKFEGQGLYHSRSCCLWLWNSIGESWLFHFCSNSLLCFWKNSRKWRKRVVFCHTCYRPKWSSCLLTCSHLRNKLVDDFFQSLALSLCLLNYINKQNILKIHVSLIFCDFQQKQCVGHKAALVLTFMLASCYRLCLFGVHFPVFLVQAYYPHRNCWGEQQARHSPIMSLYAK